ncbi:MAG: nucleoside deaminase [Fimbriimonadaceae bacterium]|nr:nucleoside deaminase [Fimbriimonadaceae bacterium]
MTDHDGLGLAIDICRAGIAAGQSPFGAAIVRGDEVVAVCHNRVWATGDPTAHAEVGAIRLAAAALQRISLAGCTLYSTTEPCPMCLSACHWAQLERVVYGAAIADAAAAGFSELRLPAADLAARGGSPLLVVAGPRRAECVALFEQWRQGPRPTAY